MQTVQSSCSCHPGDDWSPGGGVSDAQTHKFFSISLNMPSVPVPWFTLAHWPAVPLHRVGASGGV